MHLDSEAWFPSPYFPQKLYKSKESKMLMNPEIMRGQHKFGGIPAPIGPTQLNESCFTREDFLDLPLPIIKAKEKTKQCKTKQNNNKIRAIIIAVS